MTAERRINALVVLLAIVLVVVVRPVRTELAVGGPTIECDVASFVVGERARVVTDACRDAFRGRAAAALIVLAGIAMLASQLVRRTDDASDDVTEPLRAPGEDPTVLGGLRAALANPSFRILAVLAVALLVVVVIVAWPVLTGEPFAGGRALAVALVGSAVGVASSMLVWLVQYHRGLALGAVWHRTGVPRALILRVCGGCATLAVVALAIGGDSGVRPPVSESTVAVTDAPLAEDLTPEPTFAAPNPIAAPPTAGPPPLVEPAPAPVTSTTTPSLPPPTTSSPVPLSVHDASWFAANPTPLDRHTVPRGALPVGAAAGEDDVHAFFRVTGTATTLELLESDAPGAQRFPDEAVLRACPVTFEGWEQTTGGSFDDEPTFDDTACVDAVRSDAGTWSIDLGGFADRGGRRGFALVPAGDATTFRLTLEAQPSGGQTMRRTAHA